MSINSAKPQQILEGDCLDVLHEYPDNYFSAVVTDPPYGLSFAGDWDFGVPGKRFWREFLRVSKPGSFLLAFGSTRTSHRLTCAIEDAGWEVREVIAWTHGQGFPKALDVSKSIDRAAGAVRQTTGPKVYADGHVKNRRGDRQGYGKWNGKGVWHGTAPATKHAKAWEGYGTAIKPAWEPIVVAMKPMKGAFAKNAIGFMCGGLNIDACRVPPRGPRPVRERRLNGVPGVSYTGSQDATLNGSMAVGETTAGRWPANIVHDGSPEVEAAFAKSGNRGGGDRRGKGQGQRPGGFFSPGSAVGNGKHCGAMYADEGTPSRFFAVCPWSEDDLQRFHYTSKASKFERDGSLHPTVKPLSLMRWLVRLVKQPGDNLILDPFCGAGTTIVAAKIENVPALGIEKEPAYVRDGKRRLTKGVALCRR